MSAGLSAAAALAALDAEEAEAVAAAIDLLMSSGANVPPLSRP